MHTQNKTTKKYEKKKKCEKNETKRPQLNINIKRIVKHENLIENSWRGHFSRSLAHSPSLSCSTLCLGSDDGKGWNGIYLKCAQCECIQHTPDSDPSSKQQQTHKIATDFKTRKTLFFLLFGQNCKGKKYLAY